LSGIDIFGTTRDAGVTGLLPQFGWALSAGSSSGMLERGNDIATDEEGNSYVTGEFSDVVDFDPGPGEVKLQCTGGDSASIFVAKYTSIGALVWAHGYGGSVGIPGDAGTAVTLDKAHNVFVVGYFEGIEVVFDPGPPETALTSRGNKDVFILKLDEFGNYVDVQQIGGVNNDRGYDIAVDSYGNTNTIGFFSGSANLAPRGTYNRTSWGNKDVFLTRTDPVARAVWIKRLGGTGEDWGWGLTIDNGGNIYAAGAYENIFNIDPAPPLNWNSRGLSDGYVIKFDRDGTYKWGDDFGSSEEDMALDVSDNDIDSIFVTGYFSADAAFGGFNHTSKGLKDIFINKLDYYGQYVWSRQIGGSGNDQGLAITVDKSGDIYTTGAFEHIVDFDPGPIEYYLSALARQDIFISKLNNDGKFLWAAGIGGICNLSDDQGRGVDTDEYGKPYVTGAFAGEVDFDPGPGEYKLTSKAWEDVFVLNIEELLLIPDFNGDCIVNHLDFSFFAKHWLKQSCDINNQFCDNADINRDGKVDLKDLSEFADQWLKKCP